MTPTPPPVASPAFEIPAKASLGKVSDDAQTTAMKQHGTPSDAKDGGSLSPAFESADIETVCEALESVFERKYCTEIFEALTRLSARQAAFEAMREALKQAKGCGLIDWMKTSGWAHVDFAEKAEEALALAEAELQGKK